MITKTPQSPVTKDHRLLQAYEAKNTANIFIFLLQTLNWVQGAVV